MEYKALTDSFNYADTTNITGLISPSGHRWLGSGANTPDIVSNKLQTAATGSNGNYAFIDLLTMPNEMWCDFELNTGGTGVTLHASTDASNSLTNMIHIRFTTTACIFTVRMWSNEDYHSGNTLRPEDVTAADATMNYGFTLSEGVIYRAGVTINGSEFKFLLPGGSTQVRYSNQAASIVGRYLNFQCNDSKISQVYCSVKNRLSI
jgi:hypothetical protein